MNGAQLRVLRQFLASVERRLAVIAAVEGAAAGLAVAALLAMFGWPERASGITPLAAGGLALVAGATVRFLMTRARRARPARAVERVAPGCRNLLVTAEELSAWGGDQRAAEGASERTLVREYVVAGVVQRASELAAQLDVRSLFPVGRVAGMAAVAAVLWLASVARATGGEMRAAAAAARAEIDEVTVTIVPPSYSGLAQRIVRNPDRVEAMAGAELVVRARYAGDTIVISTRDSAPVSVVPDGPGMVVARVPVREDGFVSLEPRDARGDAGARRLIGISAVGDAAPRARVTAPGRDLVLPNGRHTLDIAIEADDDIGLASLALRYTRVSGSGERFTFTEGEVPVVVRRLGPRAWTARVQWALDSLELGPGDLVVYRAVVTDARPGAAPAESDAFIAEVATAGGVAAAGFALDPDQERYALSQQMVILKTERFLTSASRMSAEASADTLAAIAAEQRRVRAEFVFMMGGELEAGDVEEGNFTDLNEEAEAEAEADLIAGREANRGRIALRRATRAMSRAARLLTDGDAAAALTHERTALVALEEAFSRSRIILRALAEREALDPERRLTGAMTDIARTVRPVVPAEPHERITGLRMALREAGVVMTAMSESGAENETVVARTRAVTLLAEAVLRLDPSSRAMQEIASALSAAAAAGRQGGASAARAPLDQAIRGLAGELRRTLPAARDAPGNIDDRIARGSLVQAMRTLATPP